jgi:hypothetical protein
MLLLLLFIKVYPKVLHNPNQAWVHRVKADDASQQSDWGTTIGYLKRAAEEAFLRRGRSAIGKQRGRKITRINKLRKDFEKAYAILFEIRQLISQTISVQGIVL